MKYVHNYGTLHHVCIFNHIVGWFIAVFCFIFKKTQKEGESIMKEVNIAMIGTGLIAHGHMKQYCSIVVFDGYAKTGACVRQYVSGIGNGP